MLRDTKRYSSGKTVGVPMLNITSSLHQNIDILFGLFTASTAAIPISLLILSLKQEVRWFRRRYWVYTESMYNFVDINDCRAYQQMRCNMLKEWRFLAIFFFWKIDDSSERTFIHEEAVEQQMQQFISKNETVQVIIFFEKLRVVDLLCLKTIKLKYE